MKKCEKCKKTLKKDSMYCEHCGEKQESTIKRNKNKKYIFGGIVLTIVLISGLGYTFYHKTAEEDKVREAKLSVASLFDSENAINEEMTVKDIAQATEKIAKLKESKMKNKLNDDVAVASSMLTIAKQLSIYMADDTMLDETTETKELEAIKKNIEETKEYSPTFYKQYMESYTIVQQQYKIQTDLKDEIDLALIGEDVNEEVTRDTYDRLVSQNEGIKNGAVKELFAVQLDKIKRSIEEREAEEKASETAKLEEAASQYNETVKADSNYSEASFIGTWTVDRKIIVIEETKFSMGTQQSGNGIFAEIMSQSFNPVNNTLTMSIVEKANEMYGTTRDEYYDLEFVIKEIDGNTYIEIDGVDYINNN